MAQGFCRTAAVGGATYILGRPITQISRATTTGSSGREYTIELDDFPEPLRCDMLVAGSDYMPATTPDFSAPNIARCVAVISRPVRFSADATKVPEAVAEGEGDPVPDNQVDTALLVFPPGSIPNGSFDTAVNVLVTGEGSMSAPRNQCKWRTIEPACKPLK